MMVCMRNTMHESSQFDILKIKRNFIQPTKNIVISGMLKTLDFSFTLMPHSQLHRHSTISQQAKTQPRI